MSIGIVTTKYGKLSGVEATEQKYAGLTYFKGVPYAAPPVGDLRWKPPVDPQPWDGIRVCDTYAPRAWQPFPQFVPADSGSDEPYELDFYYLPYTPCSEDCLYLNITTGASSPDEKRPVYIWFHGGGLGGGYSYEVEFDPSELARKGIVVVSVGQRLGSFGYLCLPQLTKEQGGRSGNYGFLDEVKALDWVYENIAAFGGDPENITIGGQSGGTMKSGTLAASPLQKGRVKRVINQSSLLWFKGFGSMLHTIPEAEKIGQEFLRQAGIDPELPLEALRKLPPEKFFRTKMDFTIGAMVYDGYCVQYPEIWKGIDANAAHCDYLTGGNFGESRMSQEFALGSNGALTAAQYYAQAKAMLGDLYDKYDFEKNFPATDADADRKARLLAAKGPTGFGGIIRDRYFGVYRREKGAAGRSYCYLFTHVTPCRPEEKGTPRDSERQLCWHSSELWYTFASLRKSEDGKSNVPPVRPWTDLDVQLADQISTYWANFMKTGDPNGNGLPHWPESGENYSWMELGDTPVAHTGSDSLEDQMLLEYLAQQPGLPK